MGVPALFLLYARSSFDDEFRASWRDPAIWLGTVIPGGLCAFAHIGIACLLFQALQLLCNAFSIRMALTGRAADLVEERRSYRLVLTVAAAFYSIGIILLEFSLHGSTFTPALSVSTAAVLLLLIFAFAAWELSLAGGHFVAAPAPVPRPLAPEPPVAPSGDEPALLARLRQVMETERAYREPGLAIAGLAARLDIPEYRLRRLINQRLGHRNFSSFVNGYRLAEAKAALADAAQQEVPVVTIALDSGFQSLGPFNRAFKAATGLTPTDYRRRQLGGAENPASASPISEIGQSISG